ncbi:two-component system VirA-like sensor kinase [Rhizobium mayense]|uniref:histidine kinase n=1 Tax=Rhizobium mayense TaxID=1312184 RepID=A0ABT7K4H4_9HYPH|nr:two-component system VirA-like sensor kinase [Rhizobium mayense]MDL2403512.1 two-component system VirA-like sensor kinase [Rhizobium mayense]
MEKSFKRPTRRSTIELWRVALLIVGAVSFALLASGRVPPREVHEAILTALRSIDINHASLQRDALQARAGLLLNYDPLVDSVVQLRLSASRLSGLIGQAGLTNPGRLEKELSQVSSCIDEDEALIDQLKTNNALLQNSLSIAVQMLTAMHANNYQKTQQAVGSSDFGLLLMRFIRQPDDQLQRLLLLQLDALLRTPAGATSEVQSFVAHAKIILSTLPGVDATIEKILASDTSRKAEILQDDYLHAFDLARVQLARSRVLLGSISLLLCGYIAVLIYRLQAQTLRLTRQLEFENVVAEIRAQLGNKTESLETALSGIMDLLSAFFDASDFAFATVDPRSGAVERTFGNAEDNLVQGVAECYAKLLGHYGSDPEDEHHPHGFHYWNLQQSDGGSFPSKPLSAGCVVICSINDDLLGLLFLSHNELRAKPSSHDIRLYGQAALTLARSLRELTDRKEKEVLEVRLEHAQRLEAVGTLAGGIAHEFNNTLGAILGYGEMALQLRRIPVQGRHYVEQIVSSANRAKHIIDQILTFGRKRERSCKPFDLGEAVRDILPLIQASLPKEAEFKIEIAANLPAVLGSPLEIQQIITNLVTNATQASRETAKIRVTVKEIERRVRAELSHGDLLPGRYVLLAISDNGSGIAESVLPHIFEPFFTTKERQGGTGLGLAAVYGLVTGMSGRIHVATDVDKGTCFQLYFPGSPQAAIPLTQIFNERSVPIGHGETVLLAEDDTTARSMHEEKIAALGYEPVGFSCYESLLRWLDNGKRVADLAIVDLDIWETVPDLARITRELDPLPILLMVDPVKPGVDPKILTQFSILRKPVSSMRLAHAIADKIEPDNRQDKSQSPLRGGPVSETAHD